MRVAALAAIAAMTLGEAQAATISVASVTGSWTSVLTGPGASGANLSGQGSSTIQWGTLGSSGKQSGYTFSGAAPSGPHNPDTVFQLGTFTHLNYAIGSGTSILGASLSVSVDLKFEDDTVRRVTSVFDFLHNETANYFNAAKRKATRKFCDDGTRNRRGVNIRGCANVVTAVTNLGKTDAFVVDGVQYILEVTGFLVGGQPMTDFRTIENRTNSAVLQARFTAIGPADPPPPPPPPPPSPVPLPAAGWLLLAAVAGLATAKGRRKA